MAREAKYQIVLLGSRVANFSQGLTESFRNEIDEIGENLSSQTQFLTHSELDQIDRKSPGVVVYLGGDAQAHKIELKRLMRWSWPVLPVVDDLGGYSRLVPAELHSINGVEIDGGAPDFTPVSNLILENLSLLRQSRKLFISYRRSESSAVAQQLRTRFDELGYDAFLDTNSVPKAVDFQEVLTHRLLDSDVVVVLDTEDFLSSKFTQYEIASALAMSVGFVQVLWPNVQREPYSQLSFPYQLHTGSFDGDRLTKQSLTEITKMTEASRARCLKARYTRLVHEFCRAAQESGATTAIQPERYIEATLAGGERIAAVPAVGVPHSTLYHKTNKRFLGTQGSFDEVRLLYDGRGMLKDWSDCMEWLNQFLPVKAFNTTEAMQLRGF